MSAISLIAVDWGTTSLRLYAIGQDGGVVDSTETADGILTVANGQFEAVLHTALGSLSVELSDQPIVLSGMIGSRQGWIEAPYVNCPATVADLAANLVSVDNNIDRSIYLIPGIESRSDTGVPDVIRGEETQIFGALTKLNVNDALFVLPGTHSKWVTVSDGRIVTFQTYMTGEVFSALKQHTILGRMMAEPANDASFGRGVEASRSDGGPGHLLHQIFSTRTLGLFGELPDDEAAAYLSGLLIGSELRAGARGQNQTLHIMAGSTLSGLYVRAAQSLELDVVAVDPASVVFGHCAIAAAAGL